VLDTSTHAKAYIAACGTEALELVYFRGMLIALN
jgi:hypothetical protein